jgi:NADPH-dependent curcumin reductase CurA
MAAAVNRQVLLKSRPDGAPGLDNFEFAQRLVPEPGDGEVLMRNRYLSLDPYMRGRMSAAKSYAMPSSSPATPCSAMAAGRIMRFPAASACASSIPRPRQ